MPFTGWAVPQDIYRTYRSDHENVEFLNKRLIEQEGEFKPQASFGTGIAVGAALTAVLGFFLIHK